LRPHDTIVVVGNGLSRKDIDLWQLKKEYIVYGCNAIYRDFQPDILFCVDDRMCNELHVSGYSKAHTVVTPNKYSCPSATHININSKWNKWNCGALACLYAATQKPKLIYLLGFDIVQEKYRNIYEGTLHYQGKNSPSDGRVGLATKEQLCWTFHSFPSIEFRRVSRMAIGEFRRFRNYRIIEKLPYGNSKYEI